MTATVSQEEYYAKVPKAVVYHPHLTGNDVRVYATLSERAGDKRAAWPGIRRIASDIGVSTATVQKALDSLEFLNLIEVERSKGQVNHYHLPLLATVSESSTPPSQELARGVSESDTELDQRTTPSPNGDITADLFRAFYRHWVGQDYKPSHTLTDTERARINKAVKQAAGLGITPGEVLERGKRYKSAWSAMEPSPQALLANWSRFAPEVPVEDCPECENRGVVWFNPEGERVSFDALEAEADHCPSCHSGVVS